MNGVKRGLVTQFLNCSTTLGVFFSLCFLFSLSLTFHILSFLCFMFANLLSHVPSFGALRHHSLPV